MGLRTVAIALFALLAFEPAGVAGQELEVSTEGLGSDSLFLEARMAVHETRYELAHDLLRRITEGDPDFRLAWGYFAAVDMLLFRNPADNVAEARKSAEGRSKGERQMTEILALFAAGELEDCRSRLVEFLETYPDDRFANHMLGFVTTDLGRASDAVEILRELLRIHPDYHPAWNHLGYAFLESGDLNFAKEAFTRFLDASPDNPSAYDSMAEYVAETGDVAGAVAHLNRAVELEPRMAFAWMHMGDILANSGDVAGAEEAYRKADESSVLYGDDFRSVLAEKIDSLADL